MKAYRFKAVYNDLSLFEFQVSESSDFNFLAQNLCDSMQVEFDKSKIFLFTKKKGRNWDSTTKICDDELSTPLISVQFRAGKKIFVTFDESTKEGIEIHFIEKTSNQNDDFELISETKSLDKTQLSKLSLTPNSENEKTSSKRAQLNESELVDEENDEDFDDDYIDDEEELNDDVDEFDENFSADDDEDDLEESAIFDADEIEDIDEDLDDALDIDDEDDEYIADEDDFYPEDDEDFMENYDNDDDDDEYYDRDDYDDYYEYDEDDDDDDDRY